MLIWLKRLAYVVLAFSLVGVVLYFNPMTKNVNVETRYGTLLGKHRSGVNVFLGVPFSQAPLGELRWKAPQPLEAWEGKRKAFRKSKACLQGAEPNPAILMGESEDCLYLNIWVPEGEGPFPVMFWFHGGGFMLGSASEPGYDGAKLARHEKVAVVSSNYRLGYQGFLRLPLLEGEQVEGNQAFLDQLAAIKWIKNNGKAFNLDTDNITLFGESAGSMSVCMLLASPLSNELFHKVIMQSGSCALNLLHTKNQAEEYGEAFLEKIGCSKNKNPLSCARSRTVDQIYKALDVQKNEMFTKGFSDWSFAPASVMDTAFLPVAPLDLLTNSTKKNIALMIGVTANEGSLFDGMNPHAKPGDDWAAFLDGEKRFPGLGQQLSELYPWDGVVKSGQISSQILSEAVMTCPSQYLADIWSVNNPTYFYYFNQEVTAPIFELMALEWSENAGELGVAHSTEIPYIFRVNGVLGFVWKAHQKKLRDKMSKAWVNFAKTGNPNGSEEIWWPAYDVQNRNYVELNAVDYPDASAIKNNLRREYCDFWYQHPLKLH